MRAHEEAITASRDAACLDNFLQAGGLYPARKHAGVTKASLIAALADVGASQDHAVTYRERYVASADGRSAAPDGSASCHYAR